MVPPWITGKVVDQVTSGSLNHALLMQATLSILGCALSVYVLRFIWRSFLYYCSYRLGAHIRQSIYQSLMNQSQGFYHRFKTGDLMARATNDVTAVEMAAGEAILALFDGLLTGAVVLFILFVVIDWRLAALALFPWPLMGLYFWKITRELHGAFVTAQERFSELNDRVQERVSSVRLIKAYGLEKLAADEFNQAAQLAAEANITVARAEAKYDPVVIFTVGGSFLLAVGGGAWLIQMKELTIGELTSFTLYLGHLIWPMFAYGWLLNLLERGNAAYQRIDAILQSQPDIQDTGQRQIAQRGDLRWAIPSFCYSGQEAAILKGFHGEVRAQESVGIVGATGAGKSTFLDLLTRRLEHDNVDIRLNDIPIQEFSLQSLRDYFSVVPQEPFLFSTSVRNNVALGKPDATQNEVEEACRLANIHDDILLFPDAYNTLVGEKGVTLSGGQKQRLAIARALLLDSPVLILDDALSAVDVGTEKAILKALLHIQNRRSLIVVSHRLSVMESMDQIYVLGDESVLQQGTHKELIQQTGWYHSMYQYQQLEQLVEEGR